MDQKSNSFSLEESIFLFKIKPRVLEGEITSGIIARQLSNLNHLTLEVTDACNLNCEYCGYGSLLPFLK